MKSEKEIYEMLFGATQDCIAIGRAWNKIDALSSTRRDRNLKEMYSWTAVETLCDVLEIDSCMFWNKIVEACPNVGKITICHRTMKKQEGRIIGHAIGANTIELTGEGLSILFEELIKLKGREAFETMMEHAGWFKIQSSGEKANE